MFRPIYKGHLKCSKSHIKRRAMAEHFCCDNTLSLFMKLEKLIQISVLIFCADEVFTKVRDV